MLKEDLRQFFGTNFYYQIQPTKALMTDGVKYFADNANAYWLVTDIAVNGLMHDKLKNEEFLVIKTKRNDDHKIVVTYEDGNYNVLLREEYQLAELPDDGEFTIWMEGNVMLLPSEH